MTKSTNSVTERFLKLNEQYMEAVSREAALREAAQVLPLKEFAPFRRSNSAVVACFGLIEWGLGLDLPQKVFDDPIFIGIYDAGVDLVCVANVSIYNR